MGSSVPAADVSSASMLPGYGFQQPVTGFELPQTSVPAMATTHVLGGMPNAVMTLDNPGAYEITPEVFEAFSYAEPISTNMAPAFGARLA